jgi:alpha/beta superfamily hydrolase
METRAHLRDCGVSQVGSPPRDGASELGASTMDLMASHGLRTYAPDLRGLGGTGRDEPGFTTPKRCAADLRDVMKFVRSRHPDVSPLLVGWSQGAAVAQLYAQVLLLEAFPLFGVASCGAARGSCQGRRCQFLGDEIIRVASE